MTLGACQGGILLLVRQLGLFTLFPPLFQFPFADDVAGVSMIFIAKF